MNRHRGSEIKRWPRLALVVLACAELLVLVPPLAHAAGSESQEDERQAVHAILETLERESPPSVESVVKQLLGRGPAVAPALVEVGCDLTSVDQIEASVAALRKLAPNRTEEYLFVVIDGTADLRSRATAYRHLGEAGAAACIPRVIAKMGANEPRLKRTVERALIQLLRRHDAPGLYNEVSRALRSAPEETRARVICSIGESDSAFGLDYLVQLIGVSPGLDLAVVTAIAQMPREEMADRVVARLRPLLMSADLNLRRETITALAVFSDVDSAMALIENLTDEHRGIRGNSLWALQTMSGLKFPGSPERWKSWYEEEVVWWEAEGEELLATLESDNDLQIIEALRWLSEHRLYRMKISGSLHRLLEHHGEDVRAAAHAALERLGLASGRKQSDAKAAFAARGFVAITPERLAEPKAEPIEEPLPAESRSSLLVVIFGTGTLLVLLFRVFGLTTIDRITRMMKGPERQRIVLTVGVKEREEMRR